MFVQNIVAVLIAVASLTNCFDGLSEQLGEYPYPTCEDCRDPELMVAPGIGFDLTHSYGTVAIRFQNETVAFIGRVDGNDAFKSLMHHHSFESSRPQRPQTPWEKLKDAWERAKRRRNKSRGLPATEEVGTIANVLIQLRAMAEESLGHSINATVAAAPPLPGLTEEDLDDAMEYAGLKLVRRYNFYGPVHEAAAAIAGAGHGLCADPKDIESCEDEERYMRGFGLLSLSFTDFLLSLEWDVCSAAHRCWVIRTEPNFGLGLRYRYLYPDPVVYWNEVHKWIYEFVRPNAQGIDRLQLLGDKASNEDFLDALRHALRDLEPKLAVTLDESEKLDPLSLAAKGAAEFAKRFQEMTWGCKESLQCNETEIVENPVAEL